MERNNIEFYKYENELHCFCDSVPTAWEDVPCWAKEDLKQHRLENPQFVKLVNTKPLNFGGDSLKKYTYYIFGKLDHVPDISKEGKITPECCTCELFSKRELEQLSLVYLPDDQIAERLFISTLTVVAHWRNMRKKTGLENKTQLAIQAERLQLIDV
jgi:DNA-binding CsgD family transcriptional regulator